MDLFKEKQGGLFCRPSEYLFTGALQVWQYMNREKIIWRPFSCSGRERKTCIRWTWLGVSKPTVTKGIKILMQEGYVVMDGVHLRLTESGLARARAVYEKHTVITEFWVLQGVPRETAERDACRMEHIVSDEVFAVMKAKVQSSSAR